MFFLAQHRRSRAKGLSKTVVWPYALLNAMVPIIAVVGLNFGDLLAGAIIVETDEDETDPSRQMDSQAGDGSKSASKLSR